MEPRAVSVRAIEVLDGGMDAGGRDRVAGGDVRREQGA